MPIARDEMQTVAPAAHCRWWRRPLPFWRGARAESAHVLLVGAVIGLLIMVTRPFGLSQLPASQANALILYLTTLCLSFEWLARVAVPAMLLHWRDEPHWTCGRELVRSLVDIQLLALLVLAVLQAQLGSTDRFGGWLTVSAVTLLCAVAPIGLRVLLLERHLRVQHDGLLTSPVRPDPASAPVCITDDGAATCVIRASDGVLQLAANDLRYVRAEQNYVSVVWLQHGQRQQRLLRAPISEVESQLHGMPMLRCHRSFLVHLPSVQRASGNAQGYTLQLADIADTVPVSRSQVPAFVACWQSAVAAAATAKAANADTESTAG